MFQKAKAELHRNVEQTVRLTTLPDVLFVQLKRDRFPATHKHVVVLKELHSANGVPYRLTAVIARQYHSRTEDHFNLVAYVWTGVGSEWMRSDDTGVTRGLDFNCRTHPPLMGYQYHTAALQESIATVVADILVYQRQY